MKAKNKDIVIYAQKFQGNGYYPVDRFRKSGKRWFRAINKKVNGKESWVEHECFPDKTEEFKDRYYAYVLKENYVGFSKKEKFDSSELFESECTIEEIINEITSSN